MNLQIFSLKAFGPLRLALIGMVLADMLLRPLPGGSYSFEGWHIASDLLAPVLSPILLMLLLLDAMMAMVYRSDKSGLVRQQYLVIALFDLLLAISFLLYWLPYFRALNI
jgi:hypothetical protein